MTNEQNDAYDRALSADALHQAAKRGEAAAAVLLIYGKANTAGVGGLAALIKRSIRGSSGECADPVELRRVAARAMSSAAWDAPIRHVRKAAREYLKSDPFEPSIPTPRILLDLAYEHARRMLRDEPWELPPSWLLARRDGQIAMAVTPFGDTAAKDAAAAGMRRMMRDNDVIAYCHLAEAWMGAPESTEASRRSGAGRDRDRPGLHRDRGRMRRLGDQARRRRQAGRA